jgi:hypothetical protein
MKFIDESGNVTETKKHGEVAGSCLVEVIETRYSRLVELFGEPSTLDGYKTDAEWHVMTPCGIATIYNYKSGRNYNGDKAPETKDITTWHIGGHDDKVAEFVKRSLIK